MAYSSLKNYKKSLKVSLENRFLQKTLENFTNNFPKAREDAFKGKDINRLVEDVVTIKEKNVSNLKQLYEKFKKISNGPPKENPRYQIYHFFTKDPEGRTLEFQYFMHPLKPI